MIVREAGPGERAEIRALLTTAYGQYAAAVPVAALFDRYLTDVTDVDREAGDCVMLVATTDAAPGAATNAAGAAAGAMTGAATSMAPGAAANATTDVAVGETGARPGAAINPAADAATSVAANAAANAANDAAAGAAAGAMIAGTARYYSPAAVPFLPADWAWVRAVGVAPQLRRVGVARLLMAECLRRATEDGATALSLHTMAFMPDAIRLYERLGYQRAPELDIDLAAHYRIDGEMVALAYRLDLTS